MTSYGLRSAQVHSMAKETLNAHWNTILPPDFQNVHFDWSVEKSVAQTVDFVSGLHNCLEFFQPPLC